MKSEWKTYTVQELIDLGMLEAPMDGNHGNLHPKVSDYVLEGIPFIMANDLVNGKIDYKKCAHITEAQARQLKKGFAHPGDVLLTHKATIGRTALVGNEYDTIVLTPQITYYRVKKGISNRYLKAYFDSKEFQELLSNWAGSGSTRAYLGITAQRKLPILLPSIDIQNKIASYCESIDGKITVNSMINDNLEQQAVALFKSWFVDFSLFGGTVPENWEDTTLENITTLITRGIAPKYSDNSDQTVVNQKCIRNHTIDLSLARTHTPKTINEKWLKFGDLLINSTGDGTLGRVAQVWFAPKALTVDSHVTIVRPAREELIFYIGLWGILHEKEIESLHTGSTGQTELPRDRVKMLKLLLPDDSSLSRFNSIIAPMTSTIISNQEENQKLANLRDTLLPKLMSGVIDVANVQL